MRYIEVSLFCCTNFNQCNQQYSQKLLQNYFTPCLDNQSVGCYTGGLEKLWKNCLLAYANTSTLCQYIHTHHCVVTGSAMSLQKASACGEWPSSQVIPTANNNKIIYTNVPVMYRKCRYLCSNLYCSAAQQREYSRVFFGWPSYSSVHSRLTTFDDW